MVTTQEQVIVRLTADNRRLKQQLGVATKSVDKFSSVAKAAIASIITVQSLRGMIKYSDTWSNLNAQLKIVSKTTEEYTTAQKELYSIAQASRTSLEGVTTLYAKLARSTEDANISQSELLDITETVSKAMTVSGASTIEANSALLQFSQGMASGILRGEELNSVMENTPRLAIAMADGLGVTIGELRELGKAGKLTTEVVLGAVKGQADVINQEFKQIPITVGQAMTNLNNSMIAVVGNLSKAFGAGAGLGGVIQDITKYIKDSEGAILAFGAFSSSVIERSVLLFKALGLSIAAVTLSLTGAGEAAEEMGTKFVEVYNAFLAHDVVKVAADNLVKYSAATVSVGKVAKKSGEGMSQFNDSLKVTKEITDEIQPNFNGLNQGFRDAMDGAFSFADTMKAVAKDVIAQLFDIYVTQQLVASAMNMFSGFGATSSPSGLPAGADYSHLPKLSFAGGGYTGDGSRSGGVDGIGGFPAILHPNETVVDHENGGGVGATVNVYNYGNDDVSVQEDEAGQIDIIISKISNDITRGTGSIGSSLEGRYGLSKV